MTTCLPSYCCGAACKEDDVSQWTRRDVVADAAASEPLELPRARDMAEAAAERRSPAPRGDSCTFNATGDPITTYGYESTVSGTMSCPADVDSSSCMTEMGYSTSSTVSTYTDNVSLGSPQSTHTHTHHPFPVLSSLSLFAFSSPNDPSRTIGCQAVLLTSGLERTCYPSEDRLETDMLEHSRHSP